MADRRFEIVIVGGGHAGYEAAHAAASMGAETALVTLAPEMMGQLSCNPSVGGIAKGHLVREIDALGGIIGRIADRTAIQYRLLNRSRGPAVQAPRTQNDKRMFRAEVLKILKKKDLLEIVEGEAVELDPGSAAPYKEMSLEDLRKELEKAVGNEDYEKAARIRDEISKRKS